MRETKLCYPRVLLTTDDSGSKLFRKECDFMNEKMVDILKYFFLTFVSLEIMYYIARSSLNIGLVLLISIIFTVLYSLDKFRLFGRPFSRNKGITADKTKKEQAM